MTPVIRGRRKMVTDEPMRIAPELMGWPLASVRRRFAAFAFDAALFWVVVFTLFLALSVWSFHRADNRLIPDIRTATGMSDTDARSALADSIMLRFLTIVLERQPDTLPPAATEQIRAGDYKAFLADFGGDNTRITYGGKETRLIHKDEDLDLQIGNDVLLGDLDTFFGWGAFFVGWFTLWTWTGKGRTLGKRIFGLKVARLDGRPLRLWDSFGRAGGYTASAATAMLGFLEAAWHPNRQALHDKISGTVVLRVRRGQAAP